MIEPKFILRFGIKRAISYVSAWPTATPEAPWNRYVGPGGSTRHLHQFFKGSFLMLQVLSDVYKKVNERKTCKYESSHFLDI